MLRDRVACSAAILYVDERSQETHFALVPYRLSENSSAHDHAVTRERIARNSVTASLSVASFDHCTMV